MKRVWQIGVIVRDLEKTAENLMDLLGIEERPYINKVGRRFKEKGSSTIYKGNDQSRASCMTCCFEFDNIEIEFIQPCGDEPSAWNEFLNVYGEGIHHLGWKTDDVNKARQKFRAKGYEEIQAGSWGEGEYHYFDTSKSLGFVIEMLKSY